MSKRRRDADSHFDNSNSEATNEYIRREVCATITKHRISNSLTINTFYKIKAMEGTQRHNMSDKCSSLFVISFR